MPLKQKVGAALAFMALIALASQIFRETPSVPIIFFGLLVFFVGAMAFSDAKAKAAGE